MPQKNNFFVFCCLVGMNIFLNCGCQQNEDKNINRILDSYSDDLKYTFKKAYYFMPLPVFIAYRSAVLSINPAAEYDEAMLNKIAPRNIRANIHKAWCIFFNSEKISLIIEFPNKRIFKRYAAKMEKQKGITKDTLKKLLQFEYVVLFLDEGGELASDNYVDISEDALINGEARYWLSEDLYSYFLSNAFDRDMNKLVNKLRQQ